MYINTIYRHSYTPSTTGTICIRISKYIWMVYGTLYPSEKRVKIIERNKDNKYRTQFKNNNIKYIKGTYRLLHDKPRP